MLPQCPPEAGGLTWRQSPKEVRQGQRRLVAPGRPFSQPVAGLLTRIGVLSIPPVGEAKAGGEPGVSGQITLEGRAAATATAASVSMPAPAATCSSAAAASTDRRHQLLLWQLLHCCDSGHRRRALVQALVMVCLLCQSLRVLVVH
jgi:hypothetical protein